MSTFVTTVTSVSVLHARPVGVIAQTVVLSGHRIMISRPDGVPINAGSVLEILALGLTRGEIAIVSCENSDAKPTVTTIARLLHGGTVTGVGTVVPEGIPQFA
jgi:phosphocarrier protein HPr